ncbi:MAG: hypothetical protein ACXAD7_23185 [Candidatus Kariarchaeaceae archaeon]|jgi:hypothetical protein
MNHKGNMDGSPDLPSHVPLKIDPEDYPRFQQYLRENGFKWTPFQIVKPQQLFGVVKKDEFIGKKVEHHIRGYVNGTIETEFELSRLSNVFNHLTTRSYSAHRKMIEILETLKIDYQIDENLMNFYDLHAEVGFTRDFMEFPRWLFAGVIFWTPLGIIWRVWYEVRNWISMRFLKQQENKPEKLTLAD